MSRGISSDIEIGLTAATTVRVCFPLASTDLLRQLWAVCSMIVSWTGYPAPLLSWTSFAPPTRVMTTLKEEIEVLEGRYW